MRLEKSNVPAPIHVTSTCPKIILIVCQVRKEMPMCPLLYIASERPLFFEIDRMAREETCSWAAC